MKSKMGKMELNLCQHCGRVVKGTEHICPKCGRALSDALKEISWEELLEAEPEYEQIPCQPEVRALFKTISESHELEIFIQGKCRI